jgi:general secretion pathway protein A
MYLAYFDLRERPFSITPDPRFLYMSARHREALAHLLYGLGEGGGFVQLTGEVGTGKTTICRCLLEQVPENVDIAMVLNPKVTAAELLATVCDELGIPCPDGNSSIKTLVDTLNRYLLDAHARGRRTVLIIDEAQNLSADVLEQVRLLTNLETATQKLLQIILIGQPELRDMLARDEMRQLAQRVTARYHLEPISREETEAYIRHRLRICGTSKVLFSKDAIRRIQQLSGGIPRLINVLCDRAMLGAYVENKPWVDSGVVRKAAREVLNVAPGRRKGTRLPWVLAGVGLLALAVAGYVYQPWVKAPVPLPVTATQPPPGTAGPSAVPAQPEPSSPQRPPAQTRPPQAPPLESHPVPEPAAAAEPPVPAASPPVTNPVAAVPAAQNSGQPADLGTLLGAADSSWYRAAWTGLMRLWAVELPPDVKPDFCKYALEYGLLCSTRQGNWNTVRHTNRPAILKLVATDGTRVPVLLEQLDGQRAGLVLGNESHTLDLDQVDPFWFGQYTLLLQAPPGGRLLMKMGDRNPDVAWLREQLEQAQGVKVLSPDKETFDYPLQKQVLEFQHSHGLVADGVVGKNTLIQLNSSAGREGVPVLQPAAAE